uniref:Putative evasin n=1 Tax=Rhipicephalus microplus TaxID=6941 RepID=A0A6G5A1K2_RHIMP
MGVLNIAVVAVVPLVFIVVLSHPESQKFECGPYCPEQGVTYNSCWTVCESSVNEGLDPFNTKNGRFRNGTPCWLEDSGHKKGVCCGGECVKNGTDNTCKSKMPKCRLDESVRKKVEEETKRRKAKRTRKLASNVSAFAAKNYCKQLYVNMTFFS